jgi:hypothetical protein
MSDVLGVSIFIVREIGMLLCLWSVSRMERVGMISRFLESVLPGAGRRED